MELFMILQTVFIFVSFLLTLLFVLLPVRLVPLDPAKLAVRRTQRVVDFCNCFAGGVFLGTCFLQLVPHVQRKFEEAFDKAQLPLDYCPALSQFVSMVGFFLVLLMEQVVKVCQHGSGSSSASSSSADQESQEMSRVKSYIVTVSSSESDTDDADSDVELFQQEKKGMLKNSQARPSSSKSSSSVRVKPGETKGTGNRGNGRFSSKSRSIHISADKSISSAGNGESKTVAEASGMHVSCAARDGGPNHSKQDSRTTHEESFLRCVVLLLALSVHSLFEGVAIGLQDDLWTLVGLTIGVGLHGVLMAFALGISLARQGLSRPTLYKLSIAFSFMIPVGIAVGMLVMLFLHAGSAGSTHSDGTQHVGFVGSLVSAVLQALTAGTFIYVIFFDILQAQINRNLDRILKVGVTFMGFFIVGALRFVVTVHH